jgi:hypothetical protein
VKVASRFTLAVYRESSGQLGVLDDSAHDGGHVAARHVAQGERCVADVGGVVCLIGRIVCAPCPAIIC